MQPRKPQLHRRPQHGSHRKRCDQLQVEKTPGLRPRSVRRPRTHSPLRPQKRTVGTASRRALARHARGRLNGLSSGSIDDCGLGFIETPASVFGYVRVVLAYLGEQRVERSLRLREACVPQSAGLLLEFDESPVQPGAFILVLVGFAHAIQAFTSGTCRAVHFCTYEAYARLANQLPAVVSSRLRWLRASARICGQPGRLREQLSQISDVYYSA